MDRYYDLSNVQTAPDTRNSDDLSALRRVLFQEPPTPAEKLRDEYREIIDRAQRKSSQMDPVQALCR